MKPGLPLALLLVLTAGCAKPSPAPQDCEVQCALAASDADSRLAQTYGLTQLTEGTAEIGALVYADGWAFWQTLDADLFALEAQDHRFVQVGKGYYPATSEGRLLYTKAGGGATVWFDGAQKAIDPGDDLRGNRTANHDIDGSWAIIEVSGADGGAYALDTETGTRHFLNSRTGTTEGSKSTTWTSEAVAEALAYDVLVTYDSATKRSSSEIFTTDLATGQRTSRTLDGFSIVELDASDGLLTFLSNDKVWAMAAGSSSPQPVSSTDQQACGAPKTAKGWIVYACFTTTYAVHLATGTKAHWGGDDILAKFPGTDGRTVVVVGQPASQAFADHTTNIYAAKLPAIP